MQKTLAPQWLKPRDVAAQLSVSLSTVQTWIAAGDLEAFKHGQIVRVSSQSLADFIDSHPWRD